MRNSPRLLGRIQTLLKSRDGVALLMVLFVVVALTSLVVSLSDSTQQHIHLTQNNKNGLQAFMTAQAGIQAGTALLKMSAQVSAQTGQYDAYDSLWNCESPLYQENVALFMAVPLCGNSVLEPSLVPAVTAQVPAVEGQVDRAPCFIMDENRKLGIYDLVGSGTGTQLQEKTSSDTFERLAFLLEYLIKRSDLILPDDTQASSGTVLTDDTAAQTPIDFSQATQLAGYLVDWIDTGNNNPGIAEQNPDQAEDTCPFDGKPYQAKNGRMDSVDELALVCGFRQMPRSTIDEIGRNLTVYPIAKTNINTATLPVLYAFCSQIESLTPDDAEAIYERLHPQGEELPTSVVDDDQGFQDIFEGEFSWGQDQWDALKQTMTYKSDIFRLGIAGVVVNTTTGSVDANSRVNMVLPRPGATGGVPTPGTQQPPIYYYRES